MKKLGCGMAVLGLLVFLSSFFLFGYSIFRAFEVIDIQHGPGSDQELGALLCEQGYDVRCRLCAEGDFGDG